jgi:thioredoxin-like negative regulator of GroEL
MGLMAFDWLRRTSVERPSPRGGPEPESVADLVARRKYPRALALLRSQFEAGNRSPELRLQYAEVLIESGRAEDAVPVLIGVADELTAAAPEKARGALRRADEVAPGRDDVAHRLASLADQAPTVPPANPRTPRSR